MFKKAILFITVLVFFGCKVQWLPDYNAELETQIAVGAKMTDKLYLDLLDTTVVKRVYFNYSSRYTDIESEINSILLKNEARNKNADFLIICNKLKNAFLEAKNYHKQHRTLNDAEAIKNTVDSDSLVLKETAQSFLSARKERLQQLADFRIKGEIDEQFFANRLADEQSILESELHAMKIITKAVAQRAANAAIEVLAKAVMFAVI